jgi:hypothetical protein
MNKTYQPIKLGEWIVTYLLMAIPVVNIIMLFVWAFSSETHPSKKTYAQASLIFALIGIVLYVIFIAVFGSLLALNQR